MLKMEGMGYKIAADFVVIVHLAWILFLIFGAWVGRSVTWVKWLHIGGLVFSILLQVLSWYCPLTHLEVWLRMRHDPALTYTGSFMAYYAERLVYLEVSRVTVLGLTLVVIGFSAFLYLRNPGETKGV
jgi:hypothetical protein